MGRVCGQQTRRPDVLILRWLFAISSNFQASCVCRRRTFQSWPTKRLDVRTSRRLISCTKVLARVRGSPHDQSRRSVGGVFMIKDDPPASTNAPPKSASTVPPPSMIPPPSVPVSSRRIRSSSRPPGSSRHYSTAPPPSRPAASGGALRKHARKSPKEIRGLWGEEVFEVLVGIVMSMHSRKERSK